MKFSICVMPAIDEIDFFSLAERLGYYRVWAADSQMLFSDCYAVLALAADRTQSLRLGVGTAICGTRIPPVHVAAVASLNRLAPGRIALGVGTGNTAMRSMGQKPMLIKDYAQYLTVLAALLRGETVDYAYNGTTNPIKMLMHDRRYMDLEPKIPLFVSGFGPRSMGLAGELGDGLMFAIPPRGVPVAQAMGHARQGAARVNRNIDGLQNAALTNIVVLEPGEAVASERVVRTIGANVMASVYYFYDAVHERGIEPPPFLRKIWKPYCALVDKTPETPRHFRTHEFHYTELHPGEAELIDEELIRATCMVGTPNELIAQIRSLEQDGLEELMFATGSDEKWRMASDFAHKVIAAY